MARHPRIDRRRFLRAAAGGAVVLAGVGPARASARTLPTKRTGPRLPVDPFGLGVASGDPAPDGFVLWTRLTQQPLGGGGMPPVDVGLRWTVSTDEDMRRTVAGGKVVARPGSGHAVHVVVEGLEPDRPYWYRFVHDGYETPIARTRTMPVRGSSPARLDFAVASCQNFRDGHYAAWADVAADEDLDLVVFLGDYIYESGGGPGRVRAHDIAEVVTLDEYRDRYALYRSDADLRAAHAAAPWVVTWDDHEVDNNYQGTAPEATSPTREPEAFLRRRAAAYRAWWEHMPTRLPPPTGADLPIHRRLDVGRLVRFHVLDTRQHRTDQPCAPANDVGSICAAATGPDVTVLGAAQERWLARGLASSPARWDVLAQQIVFSRLAFTSGPDGIRNLDQWDGYPGARRRVVDLLRRPEVDNAIVVTGDLHASVVGDVTADFDDPAATRVGTELVGPSISSSAPAALDAILRDVVERSPHLRWADATRRGWVRNTVTRREWRADYRNVADVATPGSPVTTTRSWVIEDGRPVAEA